MSGSSSYRTYESEDDSNGWSLSENETIDGEDELSDELTLFNADEDDDEDSTTFEAFIKLSMRLKEEYNLREATVSLERCDKIWDTMQLLKRAQNDNEDRTESNEDETDSDRPKSSTDSTMSGSTSGGAIPYIKYQPVQGNGNNALPNFYLSVKSQKKLYHCVTCGKQFSEKRGLRSHTQKDHGETIAEKPVVKKNNSSGETRVTRSQTPQNVDTSSVEGKNENASGNDRSKKSEGELYTCPLCPNSYHWKSSLQKHAKDQHNVNISPCFRGLPKKASDRKRDSGAPSTKERVVEVRGVKCGDSYRYDCPKCEKNFSSKSQLRDHAHAFHNVFVKKGKARTSSKSRKKVRGEKVQAKEEPLVKPATAATTTTPATATPLAATPATTTTTTTSEVKAVNTETLKDDGGAIKTRSGQRAGPKSSKNKNPRPKRACALSTSYTEPTRDEEELMHLATGITKPTTRCFLCHKDFVDVKRHLRDYHRINSPESVLPLGGTVGKEIVEPPTPKYTDALGDDDITARERNSPYRKFFVVRKINEKGEVRRVNECLICSYQYSSMSGVRRHLKRFVVNGVVEHHEAYVPGQKTEKFWKRTMKLMTKNKRKAKRNDDSLAINENSTRNDVTNDNDRRKRALSSSDVSTTSNETSTTTTTATTTTKTTKRRKIDDTSITNKIGDDRNSMDENIVHSADTNVEKRYNVNDDEDEVDDDDEEKNDSPRDTRDSSDRDSGIGISITIKKRNNSYEVVDKDTGSDDNVNVNGKNHLSLFSSDTSTKITTITTTTTATETTNPAITTTSRIYCRRNEDLIDFSRQREIFGLSDNEEKSSTTSPGKTIVSTNNNNDVEDDDVAIIDEKDVVPQSKDDRSSCRKDERQGPLACDNPPGKVSSLKVLCRDALKRDDVSSVLSNDHFLHQCPVCCRCYPTERDVTVHMLEHKVSRTNFRTARLHGIPSSALRRYPKKTV